ncbi:hypothetical protein SAMN06296010_1987 [Agreia pratensis]|uniref:Pentapeptide repeat-containing protein n=2 Tax=Agreia pratensis TaxID=150121 RepID=A0A1X7K288_9MICO|nr:hypothetical protein SAMN06296010_1987 [Agreia pratensis]
MVARAHLVSYPLAMTDDTALAPKATRRSTSRFLRPWVIVPAVIAFVVFGAVALLLLPQLLLDNWLANQEVDTATVRLAVGNAAQVVLFSLGGVIALVGVTLSLSRHGLELENAENERAKEERRITELEQQRHADGDRELRARFAQAVGLLSDPDKPTTRQAGMYALAALADDWANHGRTDERQVCIDVLCGYLRSRWDPTSDKGDDERRIRATGFDLIGTHHRQADGQPSWDGARFNIQGAIIDFDINFRNTRFASSRVDLSHAVFSGGTVSFTHGSIQGGGLTFSQAQFLGATLSFFGTELMGGSIDFEHCSMSGGRLTFSHAKFLGADLAFEYWTQSGGEILFTRSNLSEGSISFADAKFAGGYFNFGSAVFEGTLVDFDGASFSGTNMSFGGSKFRAGELTFHSATFDGSEMSFSRAQLSGSIVSFGDSLFKSGQVDFEYAKFAGGDVSVGETKFSSQPVIFPWLK